MVSGGDRAFRLDFIRAKGIRGLGPAGGAGVCVWLGTLASTAASKYLAQGNKTGSYSCQSGLSRV